MGNYVKYIS